MAVDLAGDFGYVRERLPTVGLGAGTVVLMRKSIFVCSILLLIASDTAQAQMPGRTQSADELRADWFRQCMQDWEPSTHMTKGQWERVCRRVVDDRVKATMNDTPIEPRAKKSP